MGIPVQYPEDSFYGSDYYNIRYGYDDEYGCSMLEVSDPVLEEGQKQGEGKKDDAGH